MKDHLSKLTKVAFALLLTVYNLLQFMPVKAIDTNTTVIDLVIDDNDGLDLDYSIDGIDRFNQYGIAIIMDETVVNSTTVRKYGLINDEGEVLLAPIYDEVVSFDRTNHFYLVSTGLTSENQNDFKQGLYSQQTGELVLPVKYSYIPSFEGRTLINFGYVEEIEMDNETITLWKNDVYGYNSTNGDLYPVESPNDINLNTVSSVWPEQVSERFFIIYANTGNNQEWINRSWIVDKYGRLIDGLEDDYNWIQYVDSGTKEFVIPQDSINNQWKSGLYKISGTTTLTVEQVLDEDIYSNIWYNTNEGYLSVNYKNSDNLWLYGRYNLEEEDWYEGYVPGGAQTNEYLFWQNNELMMVQTCQINQSNTFDCEGYLYDAEDSSKTNLFGNDKTYRDIYAQNEKYTVLRNGTTNATNSSNLLVKGENGYFLAFENDLSGQIWVNQNGWISFNDYLGLDADNNPQWKQYVFDLSDLESTIDFDDLIQSSMMLSDNGNAWQMFGRFQMIRKDIGNNESINSLYDNQTHAYILQNVRNLQVDDFKNGTLIGSFKRIEENETVYYGFTYQTSGSNPIYKTFVGVDDFTKFNPSGFSIAHLIEGSYGLIDSSGSGNWIIDGNATKEHVVLDKHFDFEGTQDVVISTNQNGSYNYYYFGSVQNSLTNLTEAKKFDDYPALIKDTTGYGLVNSTSVNIIRDYHVNAVKSSAMSNGIAFVKYSDNSIKVLSLGESIVSTTVTDATDFLGNIIQIGSDLKFAYFDEGIVYTDIPTSVLQSLSSISTTHFKQIYNNIYEYNQSGNLKGLLVFNPETKNLIDISNYNSNINQFTDDFMMFRFTKNGTERSGIVRVDGRVLFMDDDNTANLEVYDYYDNFIRITNSLGKTTILSRDGEYILKHLANSLYVPDYYSYLWIEENIISYGEYPNINTAVITNSGINIYPSTRSSKVDGSLDLIRLSRGDGDSRQEGLIKMDGTVLFDINASTPYQYIDVDTSYGVILPYLRGEILNSYVISTINLGIFDLNGTLIPALTGYKAEGGVRVDGTLDVKKKTDYRRVFLNDCCDDEDIELRNVYNFKTRKFEKSKDYYYSYIDNGYITTSSIGNLENAELYNSNYGGDPFIKKVNGDWDYDHLYRFIQYRGISTLDDVEIIESKYDQVNFINDYFVVQQGWDMDWRSGLLDEFGQPVACAEYKLDGQGNRIYGDSGLAEIELGCINITYDKISNRFVLSSGENQGPQVYNFYDIDEKEYINAGIININNGALEKGKSSVIGVLAQYYDDDLSNDNFGSVVWDENLKVLFGVMRNYGSYILEPIYDYVQDFNGNGYALFHQFYDDGTQHVGLVHETRGVILENEYSFIDTTFDRRDHFVTPVFDERGLLRIGKYETQLDKEYVGLADENGELFDGAVYEYAYFLNGVFYLKPFDQDWILIEDDDLTDAQMHGLAWDSYLSMNINNIERMSLDFDLEDSFKFSTIEKVDGYFIVKTEKFDQIFNRSYEYYGVVESNGNLYLDFEYSLIKYNTLEDNWNLEIYNTLFGTYQKAVMAMDKSFIVPFNNKYDSLGDFVEGFAIGTSGEAEEVQETSYNPFVKLLTSFFLPIQASASQPITTSDEEFVLEIIDENGNVVGDLSNDYDSAILLGEVDGVVKAMVEKDGQYFIATLTEVPFTGERITSIEVDKPTLTLRVGESSKLFAEVFPLTSTQPKTITWSSSNNAIVSVDGKGNIKALSEGTAVITLKVNNFTTTSTITVSNATTVYADSKTVVGTVDKIIKTVTTSPKQKDVLSDVTKMVNALNEPNSLSIAEFKTVLTSLLKQAPNFVESLTQEEVYALDDYLFEAYPIGLDVLATDVPFTIQGMASLLNLQDLVDGKSVSLVFELKTSLSEEDNATITKYIETQLLDDSIMYSLDIQIKLEVDGTTSDISTLKQKVKLSFELPEKFVGEGELEILRIHEGVVDRLPVMLGNDYTFSFETDRFSSFTLIKKVEMQRIDEPKQDVFVEPNDFNWPLGLASGMLVVVVGTYIILKKKKKWLS